MACDQVIDSYADYNTSASSGSNSSLGQAFLMGGVSKKICGAKFRIQTFDDCGGGVNVNFTAKLYACAGTPGVDGIPTGAVLATSNTVNITTVVSELLQEFTFGTPYRLQADTNYCIFLNIVPSSERGGAYYDNTSPTHGGNYFRNGVAYSGTDFNFFIYEDPSAPAGWSGKINGITPGKVNGIAVANIGKINGV